MTESPAETTDRTDVGYPSPPGCGTDLLDDLQCEATGIKAQADYNALHSKDLETARTSYDTARVQYRTARDDARKKHKLLGTQLDKILEQLKCLIDDTQKVAWLDQAFTKVKKRLVACSAETGSNYTDDCDFDELLRCQPADIAGAIKKIEERVDRAKKTFDDLVKEPTALPKRATDLEKEVEAIQQGMAADAKSVDFKALYAKALVARYHWVTLWQGFPDGNAYVDCLCRTLLCQIKGYDAVSRLTRAQAVKTCRDDAEVKRCTELREHTDTAVMEAYEKIKAAHGKGGSSKGGGYPTSPDDGYGQSHERYGQPDGEYEPDDSNEDDSDDESDDSDDEYSDEYGDEYGDAESDEESGDDKSGDDYAPAGGDDYQPDGGDSPLGNDDYRPKGGRPSPKDPKYGKPTGGGYGSGRPPGPDSRSGYGRREDNPGQRRPRA